MMRSMLWFARKYNLHVFLSCLFLLPSDFIFQHIFTWYEDKNVKLMPLFAYSLGNNFVLYRICVLVGFCSVSLFRITIGPNLNLWVTENCWQRGDTSNKIIQEISYGILSSKDHGCLEILELHQFKLSNNCFIWNWFIILQNMFICFIGEHEMT